MSPCALAITYYMLLRFSVVSGHLSIVHFQIQLASPNQFATSKDFHNKSKIFLVILVHYTFSDVLGIVKDCGYDNLCKQQRVINVLHAFVSFPFHHSFCWFCLNPKSESWFCECFFQET